MPAEKQVEAVSKKLMELNPGFDGKISSPWDESSPPVIQDGNVLDLQIYHRQSCRSVADSRTTRIKTIGLYF